MQLSVPLPDVLHVQDGEIRVKDHRISLYHILSAYHDGISAHAMVFYYPTLSLYEIEKVLDFYHANRAAVEDYLTKYQAELDRQRSTGKTVDIETLRRKFEARYGTVSGSNRSEQSTQLRIADDLIVRPKGASGNSQG